MLSAARTASISCSKKKSTVSPPSPSNGGESDSSCGTVEFLSSDDEDTEATQPPQKLTYEVVAAFSTSMKAKAGIDTLDYCVYKFLHNNGKHEKGKRIYECKSHRDCDKRLRLSLETGDTLYPYILEQTGQHAGEPVQATKRGIHGLFKREAHDLLMGCDPQKCRKVLLKRHSEFPERLAILPTEDQLKSYKAGMSSALSGTHVCVCIMVAFVLTYALNTFI